MRYPDGVKRHAEVASEVASIGDRETELPRHPTEPVYQRLQTNKDKVRDAIKRFLIHLVELFDRLHRMPVNMRDCAEEHHDDAEVEESEVFEAFEIVLESDEGENAYDC